MARAVPVSVSPNHNHHHHCRLLSPAHAPQSFVRFPRRSSSSSRNLSLAAFHSSSPCTPLSSPSPQNQLRTGRFLTAEELEKLEFLGNFSCHHQLDSGFLWIRVMREEEIDMAVALLSESFAEATLMAAGYLKLLRFLIRNYLIERREMMPHNATLLGIYRENGQDDFELAGTVELSFNRKGANANPPTPTPPKDSPYICNMAVSKPLRRRGIGWHLLRAGEELIAKMNSSREVHLHCRIIDEGPLSMYKKSGYRIVKTDNFLTLLTLQRRRHLMRKVVPISEPDIPDEQLTSS